MSLSRLSRTRSWAPMALVAAVLLVAHGPDAHAAEPIYRCGNSYSQSPCPGGAALPSSDSRTEAQRAEAVRVAAQDKQRAAQMERERIAEAKRHRPSLAAGMHAKTTPQDALAPKTSKDKTKTRKKKGSRADAAASGDFVAVPPPSPKKARAIP